MHVLETPIEFLKGVGPVRGEWLQKELGIYTFGQLLWHLPFRYVDKSTITPIHHLQRGDEYVQIQGIIERIEEKGSKKGRRLVATIRDSSGFMELVWFKGIKWITNHINLKEEYTAYGKVNFFNGGFSIVHPELEIAKERDQRNAKLDAVYSSTEKLSAKGLDTKGIRRLMGHLLQKIHPGDISEIIPTAIISKLRLTSRYQSLKDIHQPSDERSYRNAQFRIKFEELFLLQLRLLRMQHTRKDKIKGLIFSQIGDYFNGFYKNNLPFELTGAQKKVIKQIRKDLGSGIHMNRLLQGDVGSGKTIVALMCMLIALDNGHQACLLAPTEILATQHLKSIQNYVKGLSIRIAFLSGSIKGAKRKELLRLLHQGEIHILIGTHAILEDPVRFRSLGLAITDEQHRFGVKQRAKLWSKNKDLPPHILVMTATPIPRTLAMTLYGDLDVSVIDELPPGRKPIETLHKKEGHRLWLFGFLKKQIAMGRQVYVVYPLIEESAKLDLLNLQQGYDVISRELPKPQYQISVVHGRMKAEEKDFEMQRFLKKETQIMIATTVIEVGVDVPNATVMVIENAERFGLSQLHQLRGRVGRGGEQSYCILMTSFKLTKNGKERIATMVQSNDGFEIAEVDLKLRGPGDLEGTQQSGILDFKLANIAKDGEIVTTARAFAAALLDNDPEMQLPENAALRSLMAQMDTNFKEWSKVS